MEKTEIKDAVPTDVPVVSWTVLTALDMPADKMEWISPMCADGQSLYSWRNALTVTVDGKEAGCIISYPGSDYIAMREYTWSRLWTGTDINFIRDVAIETVPGEYYLDSLAVKPEYRGHDLGKLLIEAAIARGQALGYEVFSLIVARSKPRLYEYYRTLGFEEVGEMSFFGHDYRKMQKRTNRAAPASDFDDVQM